MHQQDIAIWLFVLSSFTTFQVLLISVSSSFIVFPQFFFTSFLLACGFYFSASLLMEFCLFNIWQIQLHLLLEICLDISAWSGIFMNLFVVTIYEANYYFTSTVTFFLFCCSPSHTSIEQDIFYIAIKYVDFNWKILIKNWSTVIPLI